MRLAASAARGVKQSSIRHRRQHAFERRRVGTVQHCIDHLTKRCDGISLGRCWLATIVREPLRRHCMRSLRGMQPYRFERGAMVMQHLRGVSVFQHGLKHNPSCPCPVNPCPCGLSMHAGQPACMRDTAPAPLVQETGLPGGTLYAASATYGTWEAGRVEGF